MTALSMKTLFIPFSETWETPEQQHLVQYSASSRFRVSWVVNYWNKNEYGDADVYQAPETIPTDYDCYIFQKAMTDRMITTMTYLKGVGKKIIFDLCDAVWNEGTKKKNLDEAIRLADKITTSTFFIQSKLLEKYHKTARVILDRVDIRQFPNIKKHKNGNTGKLVWYGNRNTVKYLMTLYEAIANLKYERPIELTAISDKFDGIEPFEKIMKVNKVQWSIDTEYEEIQKNDIVLNPHDFTTDVGMAKSDNKSITAWALGMPVVTNNGNIHRIQSILRTLLDKSDLRNDVGKTARKMVEQLYISEISATEFGEVIKEVLYE